LAGYRLVIQHLYDAEEGKIATVNVVIYGVQYNSLLLKKTMEETSDFAFRLISFI